MKKLLASSVAAALAISLLTPLISATTSPGIPIGPGMVFKPAPTKQLENARTKDSKKKKKRKHLGLSHWVLHRAFVIGRHINKTGGYRFDGYNDCYGFLRRVWDPVLRFYKQRGKINFNHLPVADYPNRDWQPIKDWNDLKPGDVLATAQGHFWGAAWHCGLYFGKVAGHHKVYDNSGCSHGWCGAYVRPSRMVTFRYYFVPTHKLLLKYPPKK